MPPCRLPWLSPSRRALLGAMLLPGAAFANLPETANLLAPGPESAPGFRWLERLGAGLGRALPQATALRVLAVGGPDGVTAANRFAASASPDGQHLVALSPLAAQARLLGDARAQYDPAGWLAICAGAVPSGLLVRNQHPANTPLRLALPGPETPAAGGLLALDLLGIPAVPVLTASPEAAFREQAADAFLASDHDLPGRARELGAHLLDPLRGTEGPPAAMAALTAALTACGLRALILLPGLTPAEIVAPFRRAASRVAEESGEEALLGPAEASALQTRLLGGAEARDFYRGWLARRLGWRAG